MDYQVEQVDVIEQPTALVRGSVPHDGIADFLGGAFGEVMGAVAAQGAHPAGPPFACYVVTSEGFDVEAGFPTTAPVAPSGRVVASSLPGGPAVRVLHQGAYSAMEAAYGAAEVWLSEHGWVASGPPWEQYLDGPEVAEPRTLVHVPCRRA